MSLDVYLEDENGDELYWRNITHNLNRMADAAGVYKHLWRPDEIKITHAHQLIVPLAMGIHALIMDRKGMKKYNPDNGWGTYLGLLDFCKEYLQACMEHPFAKIKVSR